ncbi:MAG: class II aldolase/adducin family protein, partial [Alphaproteobacteria bacterium]
MAAVASIHPDHVPSLREQVSAEEWQTRVVPGEENTFLLNPYGLYFDEITASSLIKVDFDGNILTDTPYEMNAAGFTIHSAVMMGRPDVECALHTHTRAGMAVSALKVGLLPMSQHSARFIGKTGYHDY